ncbi:NCS2 family permease [Clostridium sp. CCUG 7971]|uniref:NCS2 family permease n=1 Tax=Clostridium sp. CCUG 7971 TaxID=2811414 RepID=UPI001ABAE209|nr:NCS2 family permease [Clostridium sp. CCUG 7971]MBO3445386.1 NCS2 family permease [Clostridium sp. CCUG 7971]
MKQTLQKNQIKTDVLAGCTTFIASVYIIMTNALILSDAGISQDAAMIATIFTCSLSTILMGLFSDTPLIVVPGMGINSLFTYTIVNSMGLSWQDALGAVFVSGIIFTIIASTKLTPILLKSIPSNLKHAITVGVGFLILFIGLQKSGLVVTNENTMVGLGNVANKETLLSIITLLIILILHIRNINGNLLISIIIGSVLSLIMGVTTLNNVDMSMFNMGAFKDVFLGMSFKNILTIPFIVAVFSITIVIVFENMGILYGQMEAIGKVDKFQKPFKIAGISNMIAGILGTSPTIVAAENFSGISAGGKSKIAAFTSGILFLLSLFLIPILKLIPNGVISSVLIFIGILMIQTFFDIEKGDVIDTIAMILIITLIPFTYNIVNGIALGFIVYTLLRIASGKGKEISPAMYILTGLFILSFIMNISMGIVH